MLMTCLYIGQSICNHSALKLKYSNEFIGPKNGKCLSIQERQDFLGSQISITTCPDTIIILYLQNTQIPLIDYVKYSIWYLNCLARTCKYN